VSGVIKLFGVYKSLKEHPFKKLFDKGVAVTLSSDDPPYFQTSIAHEYNMVAREFTLNEELLLDITRNAIEAAFVDEPTRWKLLNRLDNPF
jgi:adenosine deaminase